jgi:hypothetical protein
MRFSRILALVFGILVPLGETVRRWHTWQEYPPVLIDDYVMGAFLIWGAWSAGRNVRRGRPILAAAWGFTCGLGYYSFFEQVRRYGLGEVDPAPISAIWVVVIKGVGLTLGIAALTLTLRGQDAAEGNDGEPLSRRR